jgi:uncharacterized SAM-binding protein YcdF (DUF218 family)
MSKWIFARCLLGLLILLLQTTAFADPTLQQQTEAPLARPLVEPPILTVQYISIEAGGGLSSDGELILRGTIGQVQSSESSTCGRTVSNGIWFIIVDKDLNFIFNSSFESDASCQ